VVRTLDLAPLDDAALEAEVEELRGDVRSTADVARLVEGADVVVETTGVPALVEVARALLRPGGRVVCVGYHVGELISVSSDRLVLLEQSVLGSRYASRSDMEHVIRMVADGLVQPVVDDVLDLSQANEAIARLEAGEVTGRLVLAVAART